MNTKVRKYWIEKKMHRKTGYPVGTIAYYGPDDLFASKVVAGIILSEKDDKDVILEKWFSTTIDVRYDPEIKEKIIDFFEQYHIHRVVMTDRIIGCPHEEGVDYPEDKQCPHCPFWANRDRWTGELVK